MIDLDATVDRTDVDEMVKAGARAIARVVQLMGDQLREKHIPDEAPQGATGNLRSDWRQREIDPLTWVVHPGSNAWYAHIVAGGRRDVRPDRAGALTVEGEYVAHVSGVAPDPFHLRARAALDASADQVLDAALAMEGL